MTRLQRRGWWRENRWWLPAVPVAVAAMAVASSYEIARDYVYDTGPHDRLASADRGEFAEATSDYEDALGATTRTFSVRLTELEQRDTFPFEPFEDPAPPAEGLQAVAVHLDWRADPDQVLRGCTVAVEDEDGRRYEVISQTLQAQCVPEGQEGPEAPLSADAVRGQVPPFSEPRPPEWSTAPVVLLPEGRRITRVLVWWRLPQHVELSAS